jgi:AcrR family transcriptional regulator
MHGLYDVSVNPANEPHVPAVEVDPPSTTRDRLLDGAIRCIETKGFAATTARDICRESGANLASIGYHFGSKDELLDEALIVATDHWLTPLLRVASASDSLGVRQRLTFGLDEFLRSLAAHRQLNVAFVEAMARAAHSEIVRNRLAEMYERLRGSLLKALARSDGAEGDDPAAIASTVIALFDGLMLQWLIDPSRPVQATAVLDAVEALLRG